MEFHLAEKRDLENVYALYRRLAGTPFCTWDEEYPGWIEINEDFAHRNLYIMEDEGALLGAISAVPQNELDDLPFWACGQAKEIARVAVAPGQQGKGIGQRMVEALTASFIASGVPAIHLLVAVGNLPAQKLYRKCGFSFLGECRMFGHDFIACERLSG